MSSVFRAGDDRCHSLIGLLNVVCGVVSCGVPLHCNKCATVVERTGYICRESPKSGAHLFPNIFLGDLPESIVAFVTTSFGNRREPRPPPRLPHDAAGIDYSYKCLVLDNMRVSIGFSASIFFLDG
jgi:hypothetical protein